MSDEMHPQRVAVEATRTLEFPSSLFPPPPAIEVEIPSQWEPLVVADGVIAAAAPLDGVGYRPNIVVTWSRFSAGYDLATAEDGIRAESRVLDDAVEVGTAVVDRAGVPVLVHEVSYRHPEAGTVVQHHELLVTSVGPFHDLVHLVATVGGSTASAQMPGVREVAATLRVRPPNLEG